MSSKKKTRGSVPQQGGALVESLLICGVLVIFMVGIPMMGTIVDVKQKAIEASRYSAWEKTVVSSDAPPPDQVDARFFRNQSAPISSSRPNDELLGHNYLWGELQPIKNNGTTPANTEGGEEQTEPQPVDRATLQLFQRARVTAEVNSVTITEPEVADDSYVYTKIGGTVSAIGGFLSKDGWDDGNPEVNGLIRSEINVKIENNTFLNNSNSSVTESTAILTDGWSAGDPNTIRERVHGFVPTNRLESVGSVVSKVKVIPMLKDLGNLEQAFGCVKLGVRPAKKMDGSLPVYQPGPENEEKC